MTVSARNRTPLALLTTFVVLRNISYIGSLKGGSRDASKHHTEQKAFQRSHAKTPCILHCTSAGRQEDTGQCAASPYERASDANMGQDFDQED